MPIQKQSIVEKLLVYFEKLPEDVTIILFKFTDNPYAYHPLAYAVYISIRWLKM